MTSQGPAVPRRRLGAQLRRLRDEAGLTLEQAAIALECSTSKISRLETGKGLPKQRDVRDLVRLYGKHAESDLERLLRLAREGARAGWWQEYLSALSEEPFALDRVDRYVALESDCSRIDAFESQLVHGLLQTPEYSRSVLELHLPGHARDEVDSLVELRVRRQEVLRRTDAPMKLHAIIDESVFCRGVGSPEIMSDQIAHLIASMQMSNVIVQVFPFAAGHARASAGPFAVLQFEDSIDQDVVYVESQAGNAYLEGDFGVEKYRHVFDEVRTCALSPIETRAWLEARLKAT